MIRLASMIARCCLMKVVTIRVGSFAGSRGRPMERKEVMGRLVITDVFKHPATNLGAMAKNSRTGRHHALGEHRFNVRLPTAAIDIAEFESRQVQFRGGRAVRTMGHSSTQRDLEYSISTWYIATWCVSACDPAHLTSPDFFFSLS